MVRILFICLGNICRSTMAEYVMRHLVEEQGLTGQVVADSAGTGTWVAGERVHPNTRSKLREEGILCGNHRARKLKRSDYDSYDYIVGMDEENRQDILRILSGRGIWGWGTLNPRQAKEADPESKVHLLLDWSDRPGDIADPWYTHDFDTTYRDVLEGCQTLLSWLRQRGLVA